jgi:hypothetical protein
MAKNVRGDGTIIWPVPPGPQLAGRLGGATTSDRWLPQLVHDGLDQLRERHMAFRERALEEIEAFLTLKAKFAAEESEHTKAVDEAVRLGLPGPENDNRTPHSERVVQLEDAQARMWTAARFLADSGDAVIVWLRENEEELLSDLRSRYNGAQREYKAALDAAEAKRREANWVPLLGKWVQANADDIGFGRQGLPPVTQAHHDLDPSVLGTFLERHWAKGKPWEPDPEMVEAHRRGLEQRREMEAADDDEARDPGDFVPQPGDIPVDTWDELHEATR